MMAITHAEIATANSPLLSYRQIACSRHQLAATAKSIGYLRKLNPRLPRLGQDFGQAG
ncbi:hypothetical protein Lepto7375DRAFT_6766 [Leptolyngbya sp. PCC 7375]|nr:hypothetical protein Lepto7375DRAFT_6766 [Leptolyngbya sp. PCC 7375]